MTLKTPYLRGFPEYRVCIPLHTLRVEARDTPAFYFLDYLPTSFVVVSTSLSDPTPLIPAVRTAVNALDPGVPVTIAVSRRTRSMWAAAETE